MTCPNVKIALFDIHTFLKGDIRYCVAFVYATSNDLKMYVTVSTEIFLLRVSNLGGFASIFLASGYNV